MIVQFIVFPETPVRNLSLKELIHHCFNAVILFFCSVRNLSLKELILLKNKSIPFLPVMVRNLSLKELILSYIMVYCGKSGLEIYP